MLVDGRIKSFLFSLVLFIIENNYSQLMQYEILEKLVTYTSDCLANFDLVIIDITKPTT